MQMFELNPAIFDFNYFELDGHPFAVDKKYGVLRPLDDAGDVFFGLAWGTNGTAAECRRALVEIPGYSWRRSNGKPPVSILYKVPAPAAEHDTTTPEGM